jgi:hypothetical protein
LDYTLYFYDRINLESDAEFSGEPNYNSIWPIVMSLDALVCLPIVLILALSIYSIRSIITLSMGLQE